MFIEFLTFNITTQNLQNPVLHINNAHNVDYPYDLYGLKCFKNFGTVYFVTDLKLLYVVLFPHSG